MADGSQKARKGPKGKIKKVEEGSWLDGWISEIDNYIKRGSSTYHFCKRVSTIKSTWSLFTNFTWQGSMAAWAVKYMMTMCVERGGGEQT